MLKKEFILITGGASGIGFKMAQILAKNGYNIIIIDKNRIGLKNAKSELSKYNIDYIVKKIDLGDAQQINHFLRNLRRKNKIIKCLINNAGYQEDIDILELPLRKWDDLFKVNLDAAFILSKNIARDMIAYKIEGSIINITSIHSHIVREIAHYSCSKAALDMLTKELAIKLAKYHIRVNAVAPGAIDTPMIRKDLKNSTLLKKAKQRIPLGELGSAEDVANVVTFLISEKAKYITGATIVVDGGLSLII